MGLLHPDPRSLCPLASAEFVEPPPPPEKNRGYATACSSGIMAGSVDKERVD
jgi:hypothetical protein